MNLSLLVDVLEEAGLGTKGADLFQSFMPDAAASGILLTASTPNVRDWYAPSLKRGTFQLIVRESDEPAAIELAQRAITALEIRQITTLGDMTFHFVLAVNDPLTYPRSEGGAVEASVNFRFVYIAT